MSKNNDYILTTMEYLQNLGIAVDNLGQLSEKAVHKLPIAFSHAFLLYFVKLLGNDVVLAIDKNKAYTPAKAGKVLRVISDRLSSPVILVCSDEPSYNIRRLIANKVDFIVPGKQMFLPSMMIDLKKPKINNADIKDAAPTITQVLLLWHMEKGGLNGMTMKELAKMFMTSYATVNRAIRWMEGNGLVTLTNNREKKINFIASGKGLWEKSKDYLATPIEKTLYTDDKPIGLLECGINALSEYTMINREDTNSFAVTRKYLRETNIATDESFGTTKLEIWRYSPELLSTNKVVDPLSLYLSLRGNNDERIKIELDSLIEHIKWSEE